MGVLVCLLPRLSSHPFRSRGVWLEGGSHALNVDSLADVYAEATAFLAANGAAANEVAAGGVASSGALDEACAVDRACRVASERAAHGPVDGRVGEKDDRGAYGFVVASEDSVYRDSAGKPRPITCDIRISNYLR